MCSLWLAPSQLTLTPDSRSLGFLVRTTATAEAAARAVCFVRVAHAAAPARWRRHGLQSAHAAKAAKSADRRTDARSILVRFARARWPAGVALDADAVADASKAEADEAAHAPTIHLLRSLPAAGRRAAASPHYGPLARGAASVCQLSACSRQPPDGRWPLLVCGRCSARLWLAWTVHGLLFTMACAVLLHFATVAVHQETRLQELSPGEYNGILWRAIFLSVGQTLLVQELLKVVCITLVSPQILPSVAPLRKTGCRAVARLVARGALTCVYNVLIFLS